MKYVITQLVSVPTEPGEEDGQEPLAIACDTYEEVFEAITRDGLLDWSVYEVVGNRLFRRSVRFKLANEGIENIS